MPVHFAYDADAGLVRTTATGPMMLSEFKEHVQNLVAARLFTKPQLINGLQLEMDPTTEQTREFVGFMRVERAKAGNAPVAFVADAPALYGMSRMYGTLATEADPGFRVFKTMADAEEWLTEQRK